jgi:peptidoglycan/LPS O-acetylase OafA/YrhL
VQNSYRPDIDCLRAIAVLSVIGFHWNIPPFSGGYVGVDVFFVISGFLITRIIHCEMAGGKFSFVHFYERRVRRILPALYVMVAVVAAVSWFILLPPTYRDLNQDILATVTFLSNILFWQEARYFTRASLDKPLLHTWSLSVEEQF